MSTFKFLKWSIGFSVLFFTNKLTAQDTLTVDKAIATALHNNYDILLSREDSASTAITNEFRNAVFLPTLNANSAVTFNNNKQRSKFASGRDTTRKGIRSNNLNTSVSLNWTLFDGLRMFILRDRLTVATMRGNLFIKNQVVNTVAQVIRTYFDIVRQRQQLKNVEEQMMLSNDRLRLAQYRLDIGVGVKPDVLQAQIDYNTQRASQINQLSLIDQSKYELNRLMNVPQTVDYQVVDTIIVDSDLALGSLMADIETASPTLRLARADIDLAFLDLREAKALRYPTISFTSAYNFTRNNNNSVVNPIAQPLFNQNRGFNYGLSASVPLFNRFNVRQQIRQAELAVDYRQIQYENQQSLVNTSILNNYRSYVAQKQIVEVNDSSVVLARENLNIERERYRLGVSTFIELRQAEENLANSIFNSITARYNLKIAETELLRLRGELVR